MGLKTHLTGITSIDGGDEFAVTEPTAVPTGCRPLVHSVRWHHTLRPYAAAQVIKYPPEHDRTLACQEAGIDDELRAGNKTGLIRGQIEHGVGDVLWFNPRYRQQVAG